MWGAHSAGVLGELARTHRLSFDVIAGSSAGSCTVAYWVAKQHDLFEKVWSDYVHDNLFIRFQNIFNSQPVLDLNYLIDDVFVHRVPLDVTAIQASPIDFYIAATHCGTGKPHYFHNKKTEDILLALKAGAAIPLAYPLPVWYDQAPYADGGIVDSIPLQKLLAEGCDEIWAIVTRPAGYRKKALSKLPWPRWVYRRYPALAEVMLHRHHVYNETLEQLEALEEQKRAFVIRPSAALAISRFTRKQSKIHAAIELGRQDAARLLASV